MDESKYIKDCPVCNAFIDTREASNHFELYYKSKCGSVTLWCFCSECFQRETGLTLTVFNDVDGEQ